MNQTEKVKLEAEVNAFLIFLPKRNGYIKKII